MKATHARKPETAATPDDDDVPRDIDAIHNELARNINRLLSDHEGGWRSCRERLCRRARSCHAPQGICGQLKEPQRPISAEQQARNMARIQRTVREQLDRIVAERAAQSADRTHKKS